MIPENKPMSLGRSSLSTALGVAAINRESTKRTNTGRHIAHEKRRRVLRVMFSGIDSRVVSSFVRIDVEFDDALEGSLVLAISTVNKNRGNTILFCQDLTALFPVYYRIRKIPIITFHTVSTDFERNNAPFSKNCRSFSDPTFSVAMKRQVMIIEKSSAQRPPTKPLVVHIQTSEASKNSSKDPPTAR